MGDFRLALVVVDDDDGVLFLVPRGCCCCCCLELFFLEVEAAANALAISAMSTVVRGAADADADVKAGRFAAGWPGASSCNAAAVLVLREAAAVSFVSLDRFLLLLLLLREIPKEDACLPPALVRGPGVAAATGGVTAEATPPPPAAEERSSFTSSSRFLIRLSRKGWNV